MIITIDGGSATGKSTVACEVAKRLGWLLFDTGAMYRCFAYCMHHGGYDSIQDALNSFDLRIESNEGTKRYLLDGKDVSKEIRTEEMSHLASKFSKELSVRNFMQEQQRKYGSAGDAVFEGRDMGSVVFPEAKFKFFLEASLGERARRRYLELKDKFPHKSKSFDLNEVKRELAERDKRDEERAHSPLIVPENALVIDTSNMDIEEIINLICKRAQGSGA